jgi:hypothetical protein
LGRHIKMDARQLGVSMMRATQSDGGRLPFLVPGEAVKEDYLELQKYRHVLYEDDADVKAALYVAWFPTVMHADRGRFEAHVSEALDRNVSISQISLEGAIMPPPSGGAIPYTLSLEELGVIVPAGPRPCYNPLASVWGLNAGIVASIGQLAGTDGLENI